MIRLGKRASFWYPPTREVMDLPDWSYQTVFRPLLFALPTDTARRLTLGAMGTLAALPGGTWLIDALGHMRPPRAVSRNVFGLTFPSAVGLAAGIDPPGQAACAFTQFGFGCLELGPVMPGAEPPLGSWRRVPSGERLVHTGRPTASVAEVKHRLQHMPQSDMRVGVRIALPAPGAPVASAIAALKDAIATLAPLADFFSLEVGPGDEHAVSAACGASARPLLLVFAPDAPAELVHRMVRTGIACGAAGAMVAGGVHQEGGRSEGPHCLEPALRVLASIQDAADRPFPVILASGIHDPADALRALDAGAALTAISSGFVYAGPGLPRRINEAVAYRAAPPRHESGTGWIYGSLFAAALLLVGLVTLGVAATNVYLPYEVGLGGLGGLDRFPLLTAFLAHDRISYAGATLGTAVLWLGIARYGMRSGELWARQTLLVCGALGFLAFLPLQTHGYFDPLHAALFVGLLPVFYLAVRRHRSAELPLSPPAYRRSAAWAYGQWGQLLIIALGAAMAVTGAVITVYGMTTVFVTQDLAFLGRGPGELRQLGPMLVPFIAHDRTGFGTALITQGSTSFLTALGGIRPGARWLWWTLLLSGVACFGPALWTHLAIGYTDFIDWLAGGDVMQVKLQSYYEKIDEPGAKVENLHPLSGGWETDVYGFDLRRGEGPEQLVLRVYPAGESALLRAANEFHVMTYLHTAGYPVPRVMRFEPDPAPLGGPFLVMERVPGVPEPALAVFVKLLYDLHQMDWRPLVGKGLHWQTPAEAEATFGLGWLAGTIEQYGFAEAFRPVLTWLNDRSGQVEQQPAVVHGDFHPLNVLGTEAGEASVIDWGSAAVADPRVDVANAMIMAFVLGQPHLIPEILAGYEAVAGRPLEDLEYFQVLILTRRLSMMVIAMVHGAEACGLRAGTEIHLRQKVDMARTIQAFLGQLTGVSLPALEPVLRQFE
ncbi:MAG: dihydroorotate dehydrogenase [Symbiobacteriaceae bacterium]|nr:dihydroorotate dehydrogenase [Symbiobacteriaceae bacterium]